MQVLCSASLALEPQACSKHFILAELKVCYRTPTFLPTMHITLYDGCPSALLMIKASSADRETCRD